MKKIILFLFLLLTSNSVQSAEGDEYIQGYIQSLFVYNYSLPPDAVAVKDGVIYVKGERLKGYDASLLIPKIEQASSSIKNVKKVVLLKEGKYVPTRISNLFTTQYLKNKEDLADGALVGHVLFQPLIADPKWPRFSLTYQYFYKNRGLEHVFAPNFGASFALYRGVNDEKNYEWELGVQGGLFAIMNIGSKQSALVNADYFVGMPISYRSGPWSGLLRPYHVSSHLGDEFMLTPEGKKTHRINLSYEGIDLIISYDFKQLRLYGGGGYIVHKEPSYIKRLKIQTGAEYTAAITFFNGRLRPVFGMDIKAEQNSKWTPGISCKAGVQLENSTLISSKMQLMLEYYSGKSMHGQFYKDTIRYIGIGLHAFL